MILNRKKLAGYWHIMSYHDMQDMPKTACIQWNIWSVIWAHCLSLWSDRLSTFFTFHRYGYVSFKHIQTPYRKVIFVGLVGEPDATWLSCKTFQPPSNQRSLHEFGPYMVKLKGPPTTKNIHLFSIQVIQVTRVSWHLLQNSGYKTSCLLSKLHLPMTRTDSSRCRAANHENRTHISFQIGDRRLPTSFTDKNQ